MTKNMKSIIKNMFYFYIENYKTLLREIKGLMCAGI